MRADERDTPFARMAYTPGSREFIDYYTRHPEFEAFDAHLRELPQLGSPDSPTFNPFISPIADGVFTLLSALHPLTDTPPCAARREGTADDFTRWAKGLAREAGAGAVRTFKIQEEHYYSHRGRHAKDYGVPVNDLLPYALIFSIPMNPELIHKGPRAPEMIATVLGYLEGAKIGLALAYAIREMGYRCRVHMDGNYLMPLRKLARDSGLGVIGRNGLVITKEHGPCVRLGAIDTDMPFIPDISDPQEGDVHAFCRLCGRCTRICQAIPKGVWQGELPDANICYETWRKLGTDCGVCIGECPFTDGSIEWERLKTDEGRKAVADEISVRYPARRQDRKPLDWCPLNLG